MSLIFNPHPRQPARRSFSVGWASAAKKQIPISSFSVGWASAAKKQIPISSVIASRPSPNGGWEYGGAVILNEAFKEMRIGMAQF